MSKHRHMLLLTTILLAMEMVIEPATLIFADESGSDKQQAASWPQWRGPLGTGVAPDAEPPLEWSKVLPVNARLVLT